MAFFVNKRLVFINSMQFMVTSTLGLGVTGTLD